MGHLLLDGVFDEEKYERGMIKLLLKDVKDDEVKGEGMSGMLGMFSFIFNVFRQEDEEEEDMLAEYAEFNYTQVQYRV